MSAQGGLAGPLPSPSPMQAQPPQPQPEVSPQLSTREASGDLPWRGTVELYGLLPVTLDTSTTINGRTADADLTLGQVLSNLQWASSLRASVEKGRLGLLTDLSYTKLGGEDARTSADETLSGRAEISARQGIYDMALRYRFGEPETAVGNPGQFSVIPYAGVRLLDARLDVDAEALLDLPGGLFDRRFQSQGSFGRTWVQPLLGTQASVFLSPRLRAFARADVGGFGLSGSQDLSGNAQVGMGYAIGNSTDLNISWRYFNLEYNNGASPDSGFRSTQNGFEVGLKVFF